MGGFLLLLLKSSVLRRPPSLLNEHLQGASVDADTYMRAGTPTGAVM